MKRLLAAAAALFFSFGAVAADPQVEVKTNLGSFVVEFYPDKAPKTVANFLEYAREGFYDGTIFHRVIDGFMVQGGGFTPDFTQKKTRPGIQNEAATGLKNDAGTVAMARTRDPHSANAQFFINVADNDFLNYRAPTPRDYGYVAFGRVVKGMDVVKRIAKSKTGRGGPFPTDVPQETVRIESVRIIGGAK